MQTSIRAAALALFLAGLGLVAGLANATQPEKKITLEVGDLAPVFEANDDQGKSWKSSAHVGKKYIVLYFYPGDFTPGCTAQAEKFRDSMNKLSEQGAEVIGVSGDSVATHAVFKLAYKLNFPLLADEDGSLAKRFGVPVGAGGKVKAKDSDGKLMTLERAVTIARWTFVIGKDGKIVYKNTKVNPLEDSKQVAAVIEKLEKE